MLEQGEGGSGGEDAEIGLLDSASDLEGVSYRGVSGELSRSLGCSGSLRTAFTRREQPLRRATIERFRNARRKRA
jgi:hypothetical protein